MRTILIKDKDKNKVHKDVVDFLLKSEYATIVNAKEFKKDGADVVIINYVPHLNIFADGSNNGTVHV